MAPRPWPLRWPRRRVSARVPAGLYTRRQCPLCEEMKAELALNVPEGRSGLLGTSVARSSAAHRAGLRAGTIPARIAGRVLPLGGDIVDPIHHQPHAGRKEIDSAVAILH